MATISRKVIFHSANKAPCDCSSLPVTSMVCAVRLMLCYAM